MGNGGRVGDKNSLGFFSAEIGTYMHGLWKHGVCVFCSFSTILAVYCCCCSYITYSTKNKNQYVRQLWVRLNEKLIVRTQLWKLRKISAVRIIFREIYSSILKRDRAWPMRVVEGLCRFMGLLHCFTLAIALLTPAVALLAVDQSIRSVCISVSTQHNHCYALSLETSPLRMIPTINNWN